MTTLKNITEIQLAVEGGRGPPEIQMTDRLTSIETKNLNARPHSSKESQNARHTCSLSDSSDATGSSGQKQGPADRINRMFLRIFRHVRPLYFKLYTVSNRSDDLRNSLCRRFSKTTELLRFIGRAGLLTNADRRGTKK